MPGYQRYLLRQLLGPFLLVAFGLLAVIWLTQSLRFIDLIVNKGLSLGAFLLMTMLLMPSFMGAILPVAFFCSLLFVYNKLIMDNELVSLRAAGIGEWALAKPALVLAAAVAVISYAIVLYFLPVTYRTFKEQQFVLRSDYSSVLLQEGTFNSLTDQVTVYVRQRTKGGVLRGILLHDARSPERPVTMMAESGFLARTPEGPRLVLENGNRQAVEKGKTKLSLLHFERYTMDLSELGERGEERWRKPRERFLHELLNPREDDALEQANRDKFLAEAHSRIVSPLFSLALAAIGLAALLSRSLNRRTLWRRLLVAIAAAVLFEVGSLALLNAAAKNSQLIPLAYLPLAAAFAGAVIVFRWRTRAVSERRNGAYRSGARG